MAEIDQSARTLKLPAKKNIVKSPRLGSHLNLHKNELHTNESASLQKTINAKMEGRLGEEMKNQSAPLLNDPDFERERQTPALSLGTKTLTEAAGGSVIKTERTGTKYIADEQRSFESKVPESLHERHSTRPRPKNNLNDSGKPLNEDIPVDKKPRKSRGKKANKLGNNNRFNQILEGLAPSI